MRGHYSEAYPTYQSKELSSTDVYQPKSHCCPLTKQPFIDPVVDSYGDTYEKGPYEAWIAQHDFNPRGKPLYGTRVLPNHTLQAAIRTHDEKVVPALLKKDEIIREQYKTITTLEQQLLLMQQNSKALEQKMSAKEEVWQLKLAVREKELQRELAHLEKESKKEIGSLNALLSIVAPRVEAMRQEHRKALEEKTGYYEREMLRREEASRQETAELLEAFQRQVALLKKENAALRETLKNLAGASTNTQQESHDTGVLQHNEPIQKTELSKKDPWEQGFLKTSSFPRSLPRLKEVKATLYATSSPGAGAAVKTLEPFLSPNIDPVLMEQGLQIERALSEESGKERWRGSRLGEW